MKTALVTGISGQDGAYLAKLLLEKGYEVWGTSRDAQVSSFSNLERVAVRDDVQLASVALNDFRSVIQVLFKAQPDEIYNLAGQSSVCSSRLNSPLKPRRAFISRLSTSWRQSGSPENRLSFAIQTSSECFGDLGGAPATEELASSGLGARMPLRNLRRSGRWQTTAKHTIFLPVPAFCLTTSPRCVRSVS